jgi:hypothetical protein
MKIICKPRRAGKTTELIQIAHENGYYICCDRGSVNRIFRYAKDIGKNIRFPLMYEELMERKFYKPGVKGILIDNADILLSRIAGGNLIKAITLTQEENENEE